MSNGFNGGDGGGDAPVRNGGDPQTESEDVSDELASDEIAAVGDEGTNGHNLPGEFSCVM